MSDSDWNTYTETPEKQGVPTWGKVLIGCGVVFLLLIGSCVGFAYWVAHSGEDAIKNFVTERVDKALEKPWEMLVAVTDAIQTDEGAAKLYRDNPALTADYPTEADFLKNAAIWRAKVGDLPRTPPSFTDLERDGFWLNSNKGVGENRVNTFEISYKTPNETKIRLYWEDNKLVELEIR